MRNNTINIIKRPVLPDRIQVNVTPKMFNGIYEYKNKIEDEKIISGWVLKEEYKNYRDIFKASRKKKKLKLDYFTSSKKHNYMINIPSSYDWVTHLRIDGFEPFSVSFKLNFIRLLRERLIIQNQLNETYDKEIMLDSDNYINYGIWSDWDYNIINDIFNHLNNICLWIANETIRYLIPETKLLYEKVTVKQIETNIDYNLGFGNSLFGINTFLNIFNSRQGHKFRKHISEVATNCRIPFEPLEEPTTIEKNESVSVQFQICNGLYLKFYRKTKDDIRAELTFKTDYLKSKFYTKDEITDKKHYSTDIRKIIKPVMEFSKDFFKKLEFEEYIKDCLSGNTELFVIDYINPHYSVLKEFPELWDMLICIINNQPITNQKTKNFIQGKTILKVPRELARNFKRVYKGNLGYAYLFQPDKKHIKKIKTKEEPLLKKPTSYALELYKNYKKNYPEDRVFMGNDGRSLVHKS